MNYIVLHSLLLSVNDSFGAVLANFGANVTARNQTVIILGMCDKFDIQTKRGVMTDGQPSRDPLLVRQQLPDGSITPMALRRPDGTPRGIVVLWPGFGMGARYYRPMAQELQRRGFCVLASELRGQGAQTAVASRRHDWGYHDLASIDYPTAVNVARREFETEKTGRLPVYMMCHSMGGQIASLYLSRPEADIDGLITIGSGTPHYIRFKGREYKRLRWGAPLMQVIAHIFGYWPASKLDLAGYGRQAGTHVREWAGFSRTGRLQVHHTNFQYEREMQQVTTPTLMITCAADRDCPPDSAMDLASRLPRAAKFTFIDQRLGHNRWAREPQAVADRFERFIEEIPTWSVYED